MVVGVGIEGVEIVVGVDCEEVEEERKILQVVMMVCY